MIRVAYVLCCVFVLVASGCADALLESTDVRAPRVLAAVVSVTTDPSRSTPAPGEDVDVTLVVADPGARVARTASFVLCLPAESSLDVGVCETVLPGGEIALPTPTLDAPRFTFTMPDAATLDGVTEVLVHGAVCAGGPVGDHIPLDVFPEVATELNPCADPEHVGELVTFRIAVGGEAGVTNERPSLAAITFDDAPFSAMADETWPEEGCDARGLPTFAYDDVEHRIGFTLAPGSREPYAEDGMQEEELPFVAYYANDGDFVGALGFFDGIDNATARWRALDDIDPRDLPEGGRLVRFTFVLRDGRGGTSTETRALCILP